LLRIGELYRLGGRIDGKRVLSEAWVDASWTPRTRSPFTGDGYGYGWFITELGGHRAYYGRGYGGQMLYVIPELALTVVITSDPNPPSPGTLHLVRLNALLERALIPAIAPHAVAKTVSSDFLSSEHDVPEQEGAGQHAYRPDQRERGERQ
jgi:CubicO group peptidase (beta-lactamase class C family)